MLGIHDPVATRLIESCAEDAKTHAFKSCKNFRNKSAYGACVAAQSTAAETVKMLSEIGVQSVERLPSPVNQYELALNATFIPGSVASAAMDAGFKTCEITIRGAQKSEGWADGTVKDHITDCRKAVPRGLAGVERCLMKRYTGGRGRSFGGTRTVTGARFNPAEVSRLQRRVVVDVPEARPAY